MNKEIENNKHYKFIGSLFPFINWFRDYSQKHFKLDIIAGLTVALILIPQSMAYAQLAGLPAYYGLYASFLPPIIAALFGSSRQLATGPVAIISLMTATALEPIATTGSSEYIAFAILLALMVGLFQLLLGVIKLGFVVNFLSHPVINGFTNAAAIVIATSQLPKIFGVHSDKGEHYYETIINVINAALINTHFPTLILATIAFLIMFLLKKYTPKIPNVLVAVIITTSISWFLGYENKEYVNASQIICPKSHSFISEYNALFDTLKNLSNKRIQLNHKLNKTIAKYGELNHRTLEIEFDIAVTNMITDRIKDKISKTKSVISSIKFKASLNKDGEISFCNADRLETNIHYDDKFWYLVPSNSKFNLNKIQFSTGGDIVGLIPSNLPRFEIPNIRIEIIFKLFPVAIIISLLGFMEAISIAKAMAAKSGQMLYPNQELIGQGLANIVGAFFKSYPVSGSFSRSAVNFQTGAISGISSVITGIFVMITLLFLSPLLYYLPQSVLAAIIMMAVVSLINIKGFIHSWKAQRYDGIISIITFVSTLYFAPHLDIGIMIGVGLSLALYIYRGMKPDIAFLSLHPDTTFRNRERFGLAQCRHIAIIRYNGSLVFKNVNYLEKTILNVIATMKELKYILLVGNAINELDASGEYMLATLIDRLRESGYDFYVSGLNDNIIDTLKRTLLYYKIGEDHFFRNVTLAIYSIHYDAHKNSDEEICPLKHVVYEDKKNPPLAS